MQRLGQHFIQDASALGKMVRALDLARGEVVVEIGPGHGELTEKIKSAADDLHIVVIEKDAVLADALAIDGVKVIKGDVLKILGSATAGHGSYKLAGNIPYYITGHLLRTISELEMKPARTVLMVQKEVAERMIAESPKMNRLAASVQFWAEPSIVGIVKKENFSPVPMVDSAIILLKTKPLEPGTDQDHYYEALRAIFAQPRKTVVNNLTAVLKDKEKAIIAIKECGLDANCRPQNLTVAHIGLLAKALF